MAHGRDAVKMQGGEAKGEHGTGGLGRIPLLPMLSTETIPEFGFAQVSRSRGEPNDANHLILREQDESQRIDRAWLALQPVLGSLNESMGIFFGDPASTAIACQFPVRVKGVNGSSIIRCEIAEQEAWCNELHRFLPAVFLEKSIQDFRSSCKRYLSLKASK